MTAVHPGGPTGPFDDAPAEGLLVAPGARRAADAVEAVPLWMRVERLDHQIGLFERAGYETETRTGVQAVVTRSTDSPAGRVLAQLCARLGLDLRLPLPARRRHRVIITVDPHGAVRFV